MLRGRRRVFLSAFAVATLSGGAARAGDLDAAGDLVFDATAVTTDGFESGAAPALAKIVVDGAAIEGTHVLALAATTAYAQVPIRAPTTQGGFVARLWMRHGEVEAHIIYRSTAAATVIATFGPTGRATSDGWVELATNPMSIDGPAVTSGTMYVLGTATLDGFEVIPSGDFSPKVLCSDAHDAACGPGAICLAGSCHDGGAYVPPAPPDADRVAAARFIESRFRWFFGGHLTRTTYLPDVETTIDALGAETNPWVFWNGLITAIHHLHDWHTQTVGFVEQLVGNVTVGACFTDGDADLTHAAAPADPSLPDVLVTHVDPNKNAGLAAGDRLVAVDGQQPIAWAMGLVDVDWGYRHATDAAPVGDFTERLGELIPLFATSFSIIACHGSATTCDPTPTTIQVASLPATADGDLALACDHRPAYHLASAQTTKDSTGVPIGTSHALEFNVLTGLSTDADPSEAIYGATWNFVYALGEGGDAIPKTFTAQDAIWAQGAKGIILDHRRGEGGSEEGVQAAIGAFLPTTNVGASPPYIQIAGYDGPATIAEGKAYFAEFDPNPQGAFIVGTAAPITAPVALLVHRDVSASDYLSLAFKGTPGHRIFGPKPTSGSFSTLFQMNMWGGVGWFVASGELVTPDGVAQIGHGVVPDEIVAPKQSDLVVGKDTVYEAALAWLRSEAGK